VSDGRRKRRGIRPSLRLNMGRLANVQRHRIALSIALISQLRQVILSNFGTLNGGEIEWCIESHKKMMTDN
jgi:hypothetical protein